MTDIDTARLRELAEKSTPGPWVADPPSAWDTDDFGGYQMQAAVRVKDSGSITWDDHGGEVFNPEDAEFIAAFNPQTAKALLDELDRLRQVSPFTPPPQEDRDRVRRKLNELDKLRQERDELAAEIERLRDQVDSMQMANDMLRATHKTDNQYLLDEIERLRRWKAEAMTVLSEWEEAWVAAGRPGKLGASKAVAVRGEIEWLRGEGDWEYAWELREPDTGDVYDRGLPQLNAAQSAALGALQGAEENRASPDEPPLTVHVVRRRKAGPWERVPEGEGDA